jgi:hypothetical protein
MRKLFGMLFSILLFSSLMSGCGTVNQAALGDQFSLSIGEAAEIQSEELKITFESLESDSRCPEGAQCVTAGEAKCNIEITHEGYFRKLQIAQRGGTAGDTAILYQDYQITYNLTPYPQSGEQIDLKDYKLVLTVEK